MNRRGNGLSADSYAPLVDLAPQLADAMLTALREAGVAAFAAAPGELAGLAEETASQAVAHPPSEGTEDVADIADIADVADVLDRLYVDVEMKPTAESILRIHLTRLRDPERRDIDVRDSDRRDTDLRDPGLRDADVRETPDPAASESEGSGVDLGKAEPPASTPAGSGAGTDERDEDEIWAEIVAGFDAVHEGDRVPWPDQENIEEPKPPLREGDDRTGRLPRARVIKASDVARTAADDDMLEEDDEAHYVPPPPPPLPSADPLTKGAWIALVGGPLYLLITVILDWEVPGYAAFLAVAAFIGGFVTLVLRMGDEPRDPDDGAVV